MFSSNIEKVHARQVLDSRGLPTVEAEVHTNHGVFRAIVPSGASTGQYEALELRDNQKQYHGKSVYQAVDNIKNIIGPELIGQSVQDQFLLDKKMVEQLDGTKNEYGWVKKKLGANAILPVSMAICRAAAFEENMPLYKYIAELSGNTNNQKFTLPIPCFNVINGGKHAGNYLAFQEFMLFPQGAQSFREAVQMGSEIYQTLKNIIKKEYGSFGVNVGDEGGFAPNVQNEFQACDLLVKAINESGYQKEVKIAIDSAASEFWDEEKQSYNLGFKAEKDRFLSKDEFIDYYGEIIDKYPIASIEDPFYENDFETWVKFTSKYGDKIQIVGDDLLVTNPSRIKMALDPLACNSLLLKINQIGSIYESIQACNLAQNNGWNVMVSHRSGETEDNFIADLVVGLNAGQIKSGATCRSERTSKYNQLLRIEEELGDKGEYYGKKWKYQQIYILVQFLKNLIKAFF